MRITGRVDLYLLKQRLHLDHNEDYRPSRPLLTQTAVTSELQADNSQSALTCDGQHGASLPITAHQCKPPWEKLSGAQLDTKPEWTRVGCFSPRDVCGQAGDVRGSERGLRRDKVRRVIFIQCRPLNLEQDFCVRTSPWELPE
ncbi:hypothetical protein RRG08_019850 [Elysia crispata]|uniref:Uncharacterized protein n=1 Tax=Elysia crispata TaxID=231223 RepID=A0AAE0ZWK0_9GAST|nr:hypothetical protein RRG08_019850 [Elysia crispata]